MDLFVSSERQGALLSNLGNLVWSIADQLRGVYKPHQYGGVILPFTILRRLDCIMEPHRDLMRDLAAKYENPMRLGREIAKATVSKDRPNGLTFYNTSAYQFSNLLAEPDNTSLLANLRDYLNGFSDQIDVFERFKFEAELITLAEKGRLYEIVSKFSDVDLHPSTISNADMGDLFEELIRKFAEASNEEAGEHYTPRDAIRLMVELLFAEDDNGLTEKGVVRTIYDPTAGTGGMLSVAEEHLVGTPDKPGLNPDAELVLYGQEINDQSYAICKSDMIAKGQDPTNIRLGDTLAEDHFADKKFDFCMSNPPYGVDWKSSEKSVKAERAATGIHGRFGPGLPPVSDGQMLFLTHLANKMRPSDQGGGRVGIVLNSSPLFNGAAGSGPSEIRRYLLENDLVEAIVALPTDMFFNTGIATYIWLLDNTKQDRRRGKVQLIDASNMGSKMRKNLGSKRKEINDDARKTIVGLYDAFDEADPDVSKVFANTDFGYWTITVERPLLDDDGNPVTDRKSNPKPDSKKRDTENIPFNYGGSTAGDAGRDEVIAAYFAAEVQPHVPDAWIDHKKTKVGYEIPFTRHFYKYVPPRPLDEIDADLNELVSEILDLLREVEK
jgi:type I restriction enzyme M protein